MKKAYFFDMDGTLYDNRFHQVSSLTIETLYHLKKQGHWVILCTSRAKEELVHLPSSLRLFPFDFKIYDGGCLIEDEKGEIIRKEIIPMNVMQAFNTYCLEEKIIYRYSTHYGNYWALPAKAYHHNAYYRLYLTAPIYKPFDHDEVLNILVFTQTDQQKEKILSLVQGLGVVEFSQCFEIQAHEKGKAQAIHWLEDHYGFEQTICFGDGHNDIEMLRNADLGIAMGNACDSCKEAADLVIGAVDEDGIYEYFRRLES